MRQKINEEDQDYLIEVIPLNAEGFLSDADSDGLEFDSGDPLRRARERKLTDATTGQLPVPTYQYYRQSLLYQL